MKKLLKNKRGMTLAEILVAITILMLVIVFTTPVMLSSYEGLYTAGEYTKETYDAKSEIEDQLATRNSINILEAFQVNFEGLGQVAFVNGKRAVSSLYSSLETVFTGGKAYVTIISSKTINDDKYENQVSLQTTNVIFKDKFDICFNQPSLVQNKKYAVDISVYIPVKYKDDGTPNDSLETIYSSKRVATIDPGGAERTKVIANPATGRIVISVRDLSFTSSPARIVVTYRDENDKVKTASCYLTIKTPTIMLAGTTNYGAYYTTAGVEEIKNLDGSVTRQLLLAARTMDTNGTVNTKEIPTGTVFKSVNWITEQNALTGDFVASVYEPNYYVLTGTNGAIYRTYTFSDYNVGSGSVLGKTSLEMSSGDQNDFKDKYHTLVDQTGQDVIGLRGTPYTLDDPQGTIVYPAVWGGDFSHAFDYATFNTSMSYYDTRMWYTQQKDAEGKTKTGVGQPGYYSNFAVFGYYYNGYGMKFSYYTQNSKKISYILTERDYTLRVAGYMGDPGDFDQSYNRMWERPITWTSPTVWQSQHETDFEYKTLWIVNSQGWYYYKTGESFPRSVCVEADQNNSKFSEKEKTCLPVYFASTVSNEQGRWKDESWAQLRLKGLTSLHPNWLYKRWNDAGSDGFDGEYSSVRHTTNVNNNDSQINITDAIYIPQTSTTSGGVFYIGTVAAYGYVQQADNVSTTADDAKRIYNNGSDSTGGLTTYYFMGNKEGTTTTVYKYSTPGKGTNGTANRSVFSNKTYDSILTTGGVSANSPESHSFFVTRTADGSSSKLFNDVMFTLGYASNREMVYSKIVYGPDSTGAVKESFKFCEPLYTLSHYDDLTDTHVPNLYMNSSTDTSQVTKPYLNSTENDYYNVWFPGEMYNLTKVATKDGVTVSVGYAVAGSAYTWVNPSQTANASTGLGGIYNDGVLAAMVLGKDTSFTNLLYFKDNENFDKTYLTDTNSTAYNQLSGTGVNAGYGTHQRDSVQFTAVDISIEYIKSGNDEVATYYAYYADNKGRLYKSKVATKNTAINATGKAVPQMVSYISDRSTPDSAPSYMQEIKINNQSLGTWFDKITTVRCTGDYIVVGGHAKKDSGNFHLVVGKIQQSADQTSNTVTWKLTKIRNFEKYQLEDALMLEGYLYLAGVSVKNSNAHKGFLFAMSLDDVNMTENGGILPFNPALFVGDDDLLDRIYAIDGHADT